MSTFDRIDESDKSLGTLRVQYDYLKAYLMICKDTPDYGAITGICKNYIAYPV